MNKKVIILHGLTRGDISNIPEFLPNSPKNWMGWTKKELEKVGYKVVNPFIRDGYKLEYEGWVKEISKLNLNIDEDTILVGWSIGGAFWVRWLSETKQKIKKLILIAPSKIKHTPKENDPIEIKQANPIIDSFINFEIDPEIQNRSKGIYIFISNDCECCGIPSTNLYAQILNAQIIKIENQGHFTNKERQHPNFPELLKVITSNLLNVTTENDIINQL